MQIQCLNILGIWPNFTIRNNTVSVVLLIFWLSVIKGCCWHTSPHCGRRSGVHPELPHGRQLQIQHLGPRRQSGGHQHRGGPGYRLHGNPDRLCGEFLETSWWSLMVLILFIRSAWPGWWPQSLCSTGSTSRAPPMPSTWTALTAGPTWTPSLLSSGTGQGPWSAAPPLSSPRYSECSPQRTRHLYHVHYCWLPYFCIKNIFTERNKSHLRMDNLIAHLMAGVTANDTVLFMSPHTEDFISLFI